MNLATLLARTPCECQPAQISPPHPLPFLPQLMYTLHRRRFPAPLSMSTLINLIRHTVTVDPSVPLHTNSTTARQFYSTVTPVTVDLPVPLTSSPAKGGTR